MKTVIVFVGCLLLAHSVSGGGMQINAVQEPATRAPDNYPINSLSVKATADSKRSREERLQYLLQIVQSPPASNTESRVAYASAIQLLGRMRAEEAITPLVERITYWDDTNKIFPAVFALVDIGDSAVPSLIRLVDSTNDRNTLYRAVETIMRIKGSAYHEFYQKEYDSFSPKVRDALNRYAVVDDD